MVISAWELKLTSLSTIFAGISRKDQPPGGKKQVSSLRSVAMLIIPALFFLPPFAPAAWAMHISEGILPLSWAAWWYLLIIPPLAYGLRNIKSAAAADLSFKPLVGLLAAVVFIISLMPVPVPVAGTCAHPAGTAISGIIVGPAISVVVTTVALFIQALFLAHGGLSTLGANVFAMGVMGSLAGYLTFRGMRAIRANLTSAAFAAGVMADWATYLTTSLELALGIRGEAPFTPLFFQIVVAFLPTQLPLGILEGAMTAGVVVLLSKKRPDILLKLRILKPQEVG